MFAAAPRANADVGFSFGFGLPGFTHFQSYDRPVEYDYSYAPRVSYGASYGYGRGDWRYDRDDWRGGDGWRHGGSRDRWYGRHGCERRY